MLQNGTYLVVSKSQGVVIGRYNRDAIDCGTLLFDARRVECAPLDAFPLASVGPAHVRYSDAVDWISIRDANAVIPVSFPALQRWTDHFADEQFRISDPI